MPTPTSSGLFEFIVKDADVEQMLVRAVAFSSPAGAMAFLHLTMGPYLRKRAKERFRNEGDDVTGPWAPLSAATQQIRASGNWPVAPDHPINRRSGELENWVVDGGWDAYPMALGASMRYPGKQPSGNLKKKVVGAQQGEGTAPARPVLGVNEADLAAFVALYWKAWEEAVE